jgi:hypothetical protein
MAMTFEFRCRSCGQQHTGLPAWHFGEPVQVYDVPPEERAARVDLTSDGCTIDGREFYVLGLLRSRYPAYPHLGRVALAERGELRALLRPVRGRAPPGGRVVFGWLCNRVPGYPDTLLLKARLHVRAYPERPWVELEPTEHPLAVDQRAVFTVSVAQKRFPEIPAEDVRTIGSWRRFGADIEPECLTAEDAVTELLEPLTRNLDCCRAAALG